MLSIQNVTFEVDDKVILDQINFDINSGEHTSISGPSGAGKSTILKIIASLQSLTSGEVLYESQNIENIDYQTYRQEVSYCYQSPHLFGETVKDNVAFPSKARETSFDEERARDLLDRAQLGSIDLSTKIETLSGGERQRVALIRNLMYPPKVLLLDEITAGLDDSTADIIWKWLFELAEEHEMTLVWISHNINEQKLAHQQIHLKDGQLVESGIYHDE